MGCINSKVRGMKGFTQDAKSIRKGRKNDQSIFRQCPLILAF